MSSELFDFTNLTVERLESIYQAEISLMKKINDEIAQLDKQNLTFENCFGNPIRQECSKYLESGLLGFEQIHPDKEIRTKISELDVKMSEFCIEESMRKDVYQTISHYYNNVFPLEKANNQLDAEQIKCVENTMCGFKMCGLDLSENEQNIVKELNKKISEHSSNYSKNLSEHDVKFEFDLSQLEGLESDWLESRFCSETSKYNITLKYPDYIPIMEYCKIRETREFMARAMGSRCVDTNLDIIHSTIELRKEKASYFGFKSHSDYKLQKMMAKNSSTVMTFLNQMLDSIKPIIKTDLEKLSKIAKEDGIEKLESYDKSYYSRIFIERESGLDMADLKKMFSIESVTNGIFEIYQHLLELKFVEITQDFPNSIYSSDVKLYKVCSEQNDVPIGYFYLDLFPREGKYSHAAMFSFAQKSQYNNPIGAIVCNFDPTLNVEFDNVVTYFHEFGHLMHNMVSTNNIPSLAGTQTQRDFVETPSQMFEEWCYCEESLKKLVLAESRDLITAELVGKINKQNKLLQGIFNGTQIIYGLLDMAIHSDSIPQNTFDYYNQLTFDLFGWEVLSQTHILANWSHMYGYDSSYYGYLWTKVYAVDLFGFFKPNPFDKELGLRLKNEILSKGGTLDGYEMLKNFMGREPNPNAYIEWIMNE